MPDSYKEMIIKYKLKKKDNFRVDSRVPAKATKKKPFLVTAIIALSNSTNRMTIGRYARLKDANKAIDSFRRNNSIYRDYEIVVKDDA